MKRDPSDEQLDALLPEWSINDEPSPRFAEGVWRRIARNEAEALSMTWTARLHKWMSVRDQAAGMAWGALAAVAVIFCGSWLGFRANPPHSPSPGSDCYLAVVDPYRMTP